MSLINQMLTDLEKRRSPDEAPSGDLLREVRVARRCTPGFSRRHAVRGLLFGVLVLTVAAGGRILVNSRNPGIVPAREVPVSVAIVPPAEKNDPVAPVPAPAIATLPAAHGDAQEPVLVALPGREEAAAAANLPDVPMAAEALRELPPSPALQSAAKVDARAEKPGAPAAPAVVQAVPAVVQAAPAAVQAAPKEVPAAPAMARVMRTPTPQEAADEALKAGRRALASRHLPEAEVQLRQALSLAPEHRLAREELVHCLLIQGRNDEAALLLQEGLRLAPAHLPFLKGSARLLAAGGKWSDAGEMLRRAEAPPLGADPEFHALAAAVYQGLGDFSAAAHLYRQLLALWPENGTWWIGLGIALEGEGRGTDAGEAYRRGLTAVGTNPDLARYAMERLAAITR